MINIDRLYPNICKHFSCLDRAMYEFTDVVDTTPEGSLDSSEVKKTITLGYSCEHHVEEVNKMLKEIHYGNKKSNSNK